MPDLPKFAPPDPPAPPDMDIGIGQGAPTVTWTNRRRMAWCALWVLTLGAIVSVYAGLRVASTDRQIALIESVYSYLALTMASVILGYLGFTSLPFLGAQKR